jgi:immune inhibitor A
LNLSQSKTPRSQKTTSVAIEDPIVPDPTGYYAIGTVLTWIYANFYNGYYYTRNFQLSAMSTHAEIWLSATGFGWPSGDPRPTPIITTDQVNFLLNEFETLIYPTDVAYFGVPAVRDGNAANFGPAGYYNGSDRVVILIMNIRDRNYYDPTYPYYVAGYFSPTVGYYTGRNVVTIDSYQWERRLGPAGTVWPPPAPPYPGGVDRPYVYDSTLAHEFQHLIHADWNPDDPSFMNEGCSMYAEYLCGFGIDPSYINSYFYTPDNSLTEWGDEGDINILADYGESALWVMYLSDHYGGAGTISYFVQTGIPSIDGINNALAHFGYAQKFDDVYHDWRLANLIRSDTPGGGKYNYHNINLNAPNIIPINLAAHENGAVPWTKGTSFGTTKTILGYDTSITMLEPYGSDYIQLTNSPGSTTREIISFEGDHNAVFRWTLANGIWWSGYGNLIDVKLIGSAYVNPADTTLTLVTAYGLETQWDFGFVQVSTDNGITWTSLSNAYTTSTYLTDVVAIQNNMPGLTGYNPDWPGYTTMNFNLAAYAGMNIQVRFRYMTDEYTNYEGWFIQSAAVSGTPMTLTPIDMVAGPASFQVDLIYLNNGVPFKTQVLSLNGEYDNAWYNAGTISTDPILVGDGISVVLVVSELTDYVVGLADYQFKVDLLPTVGGEWAPISAVTLNNVQLATPWIGLASIFSLATASVIYVRYRKKQAN